METDVKMENSATHTALPAHSNEDYRRMLDDSPVFFSAFLPDGTLTFVNELLARTTGRRMDELIGMRFYDMLPRDEAEKFRERLQRLSPDNPTDTHDQLYTMPDGSKRWQQWTNRAFFDEHGRPVRYQAVGQDITEHKRFEESVLHLSTFPELNPNPVIEMNRDGDVTYFNPSALKVMESIGKGKTCISAFFPEDLHALLAEWDGKGEKLYFREVVVMDRVFAETIHLVPVVGVARIDAIDITWQKDIERQLKISEENYRNFANLTSDSIHKCSRTGTDPFRIQWIGGSVGFISGYSIEEISEAGCFLPFVHSEDRQHVADELIRMVPGDIKIIEFRLVTKRGDIRWIAEKCLCEKGQHDGELVLFGSIRDITERKEMEETLRLTFAELKRHDTWMVMLNQMNDLLISAESREEAYAIISNSAEMLFAPYSGGLAIYSEKTSEFEVVVCWGDEVGMNLTFPLNDCWALRRRAPHKIDDPSHYLGCKLYQGRGEHPHFCMPLMARGNILGLLQIISSESVPTKQFDEMYNLAMTMSESITLALSNLLLREALREEAIHDPLTGLFNRRYLEETLSLELLNHQRTKEPLTVAMLDLDHFKSFNDEYGHEAGDIVLKEIGNLLRRSLRGGDIACRYGGEELTVILSGSTVENALPRLDNIRQMIMHLCLYCRNKELPPVTVSIGMSEARPNETDVANLLRRADTALYQAKQGGRNKIVVSGSPL